MLIILSQKIDVASNYAGDEVFKVYHYPGRYRNQIHTGDRFIYYQGNRYDKSQRYYFGMGEIGAIRMEDEDNYYADLLHVIRFEKKVPIYLPNGGYVEQLGYETVRKSVRPPWQSSVRPLSEEAYNYIVDASGLKQNIEKYNEDLKREIKKYYILNDKSAVKRIYEISKKLYGLLEDGQV